MFFFSFKPTMYNIVNRAEETGSHHDRHRSGRPKGSSTRDDSLIVRQSLQDRRLTVPDLGKSWELSGVNVSNTTVRRRLQGRWAAKKPFLTPKLREKCLAFDRAHPDWTLVDWSTVLYLLMRGNSACFQTDDPLFVRRRPCEMLLDKCLLL